MRYTADRRSSIRCRREHRHVNRVGNRTGGGVVVGVGDHIGNVDSSFTRGDITYRSYQIKASAIVGYRDSKGGKSFSSSGPIRNGSGHVGRTINGYRRSRTTDHQVTHREFHRFRIGIRNGYKKDRGVPGNGGRVIDLTCCHIP